MKYLILFCLLGLMSCEILPFDHPYKETYRGYVIEKGDNHAKNRGVLTFNGHTMKFDFRFFPNVIHTQDSAIHKLYGFSDLSQKNSMRIGWRVRQDETIDIFAYWHKDGKFGYKWLGNTVADVENHAELKIRDDHFVFEFEGREYRMKGEIHGIKHRLFPYYEDGKGRGAPQKMTFYIYEY